ncbi:uncharacterized protein Z518_07269 [Rhinocladiella mackenziei CBS 650.93]|uniref:Transcription factor TFIIIC triple barrel domain-containing protein n=1 Tax=Rhinocladiella mackenziei CBS 650.93 TaxID=1442369 RepID=A0A0D2IKF5_9EURO|nr:uncharacterized protein Z518_07269 [Rhinocladiella mackenziei CBS 650.93]KIX03716.1 hypothetical protein Z518_07269 [Rhinocladiella mackenziei CBS 650.93]
MYQSENGSEDEFEYEYHDTEKETFLVDIDLSSLNSVVQPNVPGAPKPVIPAKRIHDNSVPQAPDRDDHSPDPAERAEEETSPAQAPPDTPSQEVEDDDDDSARPFPSQVQILDLNTTNPMISYMDQVYSCTWTDMVGTNMFFTHPGLLDTIEILQSTDDYDLIGMSRIKLVGDRVQVSKKKGSKKADVDAPAEHDEPPEGRSLGNLNGTNPATNMQIKKQAAFLEKLMDIKQQRGGSDIVRVYVDENTAPGGTPRIQDAMHDEIAELNRKVLKGDARALARLQGIYSQLEDSDHSPQETDQRPEDEVI